jgi:hypothetical protein
VKAFFDLLGTAENYLTAFSHCSTLEGSHRLASELNDQLAEFREVARRLSEGRPTASILSEYIVATSDRVARSPQQPPGERERDLYALLDARLARLVPDGAS